jgi:glyoxylase-like metal-dependent hydrolase (beta-lactamase superfamily II)
MHTKSGIILVFGLIGGALLPVAADDSRLEIRKNYPLERVSQRVYVIRGPNEMPTPENQGFRNNPGIVVTDGGVVIVDPGSSVHTGNYVLKKVRELTASRVVAVFNTHSHGDHWLGNQAIKEAFPNAVIYAHPRAKELAAQGEGERWIRAIDERAGGALEGTYPVAPDRTVNNGETITIGGTHFRIHHGGPAHTDNDIMIEVAEEKVLFFGDVVRSRNVGEFMTSFKGNIAAIDLGLKTGATRFVPGHGPGFDRQGVQAYRDLLATIRAKVAALYETGMESFEMKPRVVAALDGYKTWSGFDDHIGRLINTAYLEVEKEAF